MPGKPSRHKLYEANKRAFLKQTTVPASALFDWRNAPSTPSGELALYRAIASGLIRRLSRRDPKEAEVVALVVDLCAEDFAWLIHRHGLEKAEEIVQERVTLWSSSDLKKANKPSSRVLLSEQSALVKELPPLKTRKARMQWAIGNGLNQSTAEQYVPESDAKLIEKVLAVKHGISESDIRKDLARATREIRNQLRQR